MMGLNKVIRTLIFSDFLLHGGWGFVAPIFAIFVVRQIEMGSIEMVGLIAATYWITKSLVQPFIAHFFDLKKGEKDDYSFLIGGMYVANLVPLGYVFSTELWHLFILEFIRGLAMACVVPSWHAIFTRHIQRNWEAFSWSIQSTSLGLATGFAAAFGGIIAALLGFKVVFVLVTIFGLLAASSLFMIRHSIFAKENYDSKMPPPETNL